MRKASPIDPLLNRTTQGLLAATLLQPGRRWYLSDLAKHLRRRPSSLQQPLAALVSAGILSRRKEGNRVYFQAEPACPFLPELQGLMVKTVGVVDVLRDALWPLKRQIEVAFIHGSVATSRERAASDIDLIVIGPLGLSDLAPALDRAEQPLGRPVNANVYSPAEFTKKLAAENHFLRSVLDKEKLFLIGGPNDLERVAGRRPR
jgi:predicted nucleotidyltransferase/DNA-binding transcriptional ArsR family regulator